MLRLSQLLLAAGSGRGFPRRKTIALALVLGAGWSDAMVASAQGIAGFNSNAPVNYEADRIELQDKQKRVVLTGNVDVSQGDLALHAARSTVAYTNDNGIRIQRIDASGGVVVSRGNETARGDVAIYDFNRRVITMVGSVSLRRGSDTLNGQRLVMDLATGVASVNGGIGATGTSGRVSGSFSVPKQN
ncbi:LptA/OstA family protein [Novosphingobium bradum]|uniref:LptA/OstA family protein n=1 Tax=Novosphingobium bradum TaxID=1737444 RepID=A0ABV7IYC6_9SPHN